jgi:hypothetical protein
MDRSVDIVEMTRKVLIELDQQPCQGFLVPMSYSGVLPILVIVVSAVDHIASLGIYEARGACHYVLGVVVQS